MKIYLCNIRNCRKILISLYQNVFEMASNSDEELRVQDNSNDGVYIRPSIKKVIILYFVVIQQVNYIVSFLRRK